MVAAEGGAAGLTSQAVSNEHLLNSTHYILSQNQESDQEEGCEEDHHAKQ